MLKRKKCLEKNKISFLYKTKMFLFLQGFNGSYVRSNPVSIAKLLIWFFFFFFFSFFVFFFFFFSDVGGAITRIRMHTFLTIFMRYL